MGRVIGLVVAFVMVAAGAFWTLLGLGVVGDSPTSAEHFWAILGPAVAGLGIALGFVVLTGGGNRRGRGGRR
jgi:hypothetical protein